MAPISRNYTSLWVLERFSHSDKHAVSRQRDDCACEGFAACVLLYHRRQEEIRRGALAAFQALLLCVLFTSRLHCNYAFLRQSPESFIECIAALGLTPPFPPLQ